MNTQDSRPQCPRCGSQKLWKAGFYYKNGAKLQRFQCRKCGHRFSEPVTEAFKERNVLLKPSPVSPSFITEPSNRKGVNLLTVKKGFKNTPFPGRKDVEPHVSSPYPCDKEYLNTVYSSSKDKGLSMEQKLKLETLPPELKTRLLDFAWYLKKEGCREATIRTYASLLRKLIVIGANLHDPESVKEVLAKIEISHNTKAAMVNAYSSFLKWLGVEWKPPKYRYKRKISFIPLEAEIDALIAGTGRQTSTLLQTLKETAMRIGEALALKWTDINFESRTISVNDPEKNSNPRILSVSSKCMDMLNGLPRKSERVFGESTPQCKSWCFKDQRERLAKKLGNPRLLRITFHTFRHWKATMEYHKTKDIIHVKEMLGHKSIESTMIYITLENAVFKEAEDQWTNKVAHNITEAGKLVDVGFQYVCDFGEEGKLFKKRK